MYALKDAIKDVHEIYPERNLKEIEDTIIKTIESEILPYVLYNVTLPKIPSPITIKSQELRSRRRGIKGEEQFRNFQKHINLIKNFEYIKSKMKYEKFTSNSQEYALFNGSGNQISVLSELDFWEKTDYKYPKIFLDENRERLHPQLLSEKIKPFIKIDIMESIINKIETDTTFKYFLKTLEKSLRKSNYINEVSSININETSDYEIHSWKKIIINLKSTADDFDRSMLVYDSIQKQVRENITNEMNELNPDDKILFDTYIKNLYFHIQFMEEELL